MAKNTRPTGIELERATAFIHEKLLEKDPNLKTATFTIEMRKWVKVGDVPYEIDVLVTTAPDSLYKSKVIFECKDWKRPVDKREVILLEDKVKALCANQGILVARSITKGAEARLKHDGRLSFVQCSDDFQSPLDNFVFVHTFHEFLPITVSIKERGMAPKENPDALNYATMRCMLNGRPLDFLAYVDDHLNDAVASDRKENARKYCYESNHWGQTTLEIHFEPGEFTIDGKDIEWMTMRLNYWVEVRAQKIVSKFQLQGQGRSFFFEPLVDSVTGETFEIEMVQLL